MSDRQHVAFLEEIIRSRRSIRNFSSQVSDEKLLKIVESAIYAPYGGATGIPLRKIRKIFVFRQNTDSMEKAREIIASQLNSGALRFKVLLKFFPFLRNKMQTFANRIQYLSENGIPGLTEGSFYIVVAEKAGFPPIEKQSLSHAMQNMWLTATAHGVGFHLVSVTSALSKNKEFMKILGLNPKEWALDGCIVGTPKEEPQAREERKIEEFMTWVGEEKNHEKNA